MDVERFVLILPADAKSKHLAMEYNGSSSSVLPAALALQGAPPLLPPPHHKAF